MWAAEWIDKQTKRHILPNMHSFYANCAKNNQIPHGAAALLRN